MAEVLCLNCGFTGHVAMGDTEPCCGNERHISLQYAGTFLAASDARIARLEAECAVLREALLQLTGAAENFVALVEGETPSLVEDNHNHAKIAFVAIPAANRALSPAPVAEAMVKMREGAEMMLAHEDAGGDGWWRGWDMIKTALDEARHG